MYEEMKEKVAIVTGAGSGIGRATAVAFAREGAHVVVGDLSEEAACETVAMIEAAGGRATFCYVDVSNEVLVSKMVEFAILHFGRLDYAHNNAGIDQIGREPIHEVDADIWDRVIAINLKSIFLCMKHELLHMTKQGSGALVNTSSGAGLNGVPGMTAYCAAKHGVIGATRSAALEVAATGIRVNAVCPGLIDTNLLATTFSESPELKEIYEATQPMKRMGQPSEIADAVLWLCSDSATLMNGAAVAVDGGFSAQ
jgi:NAD(P)-dependent dehydrogenase (short-subunit alcohol dehydrogenase family)